MIVRHICSTKYYHQKCVYIWLHFKDIIKSNNRELINIINFEVGVRLGVGVTGKNDLTAIKPKR